MTEFTFQRQMTRLKDTFKGVYTTEREKLFWEVLQDLPDSTFINWVDRKIIDSRSAPLGDDIRQLVKSHERNEFRRITKTSAANLVNLPKDYWKKESYKCSKCRDDGALLTVKDDDKTEWVFVCDCPAGPASHWDEIKTFPDGNIKIRSWQTVTIEERALYTVKG